MAHTKALGSTKLGRDSESKRLGIKRNDGQTVKVGEILIRQRGSKYIAGENVKKGADDTLFASKAGVVKYFKTRKSLFNSKTRLVTGVKVLSKA